LSFSSLNFLLSLEDQYKNLSDGMIQRGRNCVPDLDAFIESPSQSPVFHDWDVAFARDFFNLRRQQVKAFCYYDRCFRRACR